LLIGELPRDCLRRRLKSEGMHLVTGAFTFHLRIELPRLIDDIGEMYERYPIEDPPGIADARLRVAAPSLLHRALGSHAQVWIDGEKPFRAVPAARAYTAFESSLNYSIASIDLAMLLLHAAVLERDGRGLIMPSPSGSGKSTLCAALACRGWRLFSDETALISCEDGRLRPNPRPVSLKNASIGVIADFAPQAHIGAVHHGTPKGDVAYMRAPADAVTRLLETAEPALVVAPVYQAGAATGLRAMEKVEGFRLLADNAVNYSSLLRAGFDTLATTVDRCDFYEITYSDLDGAVERIGALLEATGAERPHGPADAGEDPDRRAARPGERGAAWAAGMERPADPRAPAGTSRPAG
jgi:hypothetical protein